MHVKFRGRPCWMATGTKVQLTPAMRGAESLSWFADVCIFWAVDLQDYRIDIFKPHKALE